jgi:hypothetical protein
MNPIIGKKIVSATSTLAFVLGLSGIACASGARPLPWDGSLNTVAGYLTDVAAPLVIKLALGVAAILFAVSGTSASTRQFARLAFGTGLSLIAVRLFNFLLPY